MSLSDFSEVDIEEFDDLIAPPISSPRTGTTIDLSNHHPVDMAPVSTPPPSKLGTVSSGERVGEQYVRSAASERSSPASSLGFPSTSKKHERFYFDDGNITFLVEDVLYNVHRYFLCRDSPFFVNLISNRCGDPSISFSQPFVLKDILVEEFDALLYILYPLDFDECEVKTVAGWTSILRLSTQWSLTSVRKLAISKLGPIASSVDKIVLGRTYSVNAWLTPGFVAICQRPQPLTRHEGRRLGVDDVVLVACLRESLYACSTKPRPEDITTTVQACLDSPDTADKRPIPFITPEALSTKGTHTIIPSDPEPSGSSSSKPSSTPRPSTPLTQAERDSASVLLSTKATTPAAEPAKGTPKISKVASRAAKKAASKIGREAPIITEATKPDFPAPAEETREIAPPVDSLANEESLSTSSFSGLLGSSSKVPSGWGGWGGKDAKTPSAAPSTSTTGGWSSLATKGTTPWGSQTKTPITVGGWGLTGDLSKSEDAEG